jgi:hypothetical protein
VFLVLNYSFTYHKLPSTVVHKPAFQYCVLVTVHDGNPILCNLIEINADTYSFWVYFRKIASETNYSQQNMSNWLCSQTKVLKALIFRCLSNFTVPHSNPELYSSANTKAYHIPDSSPSQSSIWPFTSSWPKFYDYSLSSALYNLLCFNILTILGHPCNWLSSTLCDILTANFILLGTNVFDEHFALKHYIRF